ncbi:MAG TPA: O-antigen ligase family protein [Caldisericia bacterium]|nr:O-antigen ligase family protein [Caldisericia bacterium]
MISKKIDIENLFLYLYSLVFFIPHFVIVSEATFFTVFVPKAFSISLIIFIFSIPFFIYFYRKKGFILTNLNKIIFLYISIYFISTIFSENFYNSFFGWQYRNKGFLIITTMLFLPVIAPLILNNLSKIKKIIDIGIFFSSIYSLYGILQFFKIDPFYFVSKTGERSFSFFLNPNFFTPIILIFLFLSFNEVILKNKKLYLIPFILNFSAIILAQTFTTFLSLIISFPIYIFLSIKFFPEFKNKIIKYISIFLIILIVFSMFSIVLLNRYNPYLLKRYTNLTTLKTRIFLWRDIGNMVKNEFGIKEYLIGIGGDNLDRKYMPYKSIELEKLEPNVTFDNAHNEYIEQFVKGGFFQFIIYLILIIYCLMILFNIIKRNEKLKETSFTIFICLFAYSINLIGTYEGIQMFIFFCFLLSIINSLIILDNQQNNKILINNKLIIFIFLVLSISNFGYHSILKLSNDYANKACNSLGFYNYINEIDKEKSLEALNDSESKFLKAIKLNPFEKTFYPYYLAKVYYYKGIELKDSSYNVKSIEILNDIFDYSQYPNSIYNLIGDNYYILNEVEKAKEYYKKSIEWYKFFNEPILSLTKIYLEENSLNEAEKYVDIILSVKENPVAYRYKGIIYLKKDNNEVAKKYLQRAIELGDKESEDIIKNLND